MTTAGITTGWPDGTFRLHDKDGQNVGQFCMVGAFSEYAVVDERSVCVVAPDLPLDVACLVGCGVAGGFGAAVHRARVTPGSRVLVPRTAPVLCDGGR